MSLCECGCGQVTKPVTRSEPRRGVRKGEPRRFVEGHHQKLRYGGNEARFWRRVEKREDGCWVWTGALRNGYGVISVQHENVVASRFAYELLVGPIPEGLFIDHLCRNRACVNPAHLEPVTNRENLMRGETRAARNAAKTHCPKGHPYAGENLRVQNGRRICRTCQNAANLRRFHERKGSRAA